MFVICLVIGYLILLSIIVFTIERQLNSIHSTTLVLIICSCRNKQSGKNVDLAACDILDVRIWHPAKIQYPSVLQFNYKGKSMLLPYVQRKNFIVLLKFYFT